MKKLSSVLLVSDSPEEQDFLKSNLAENGFNVNTATSLIEALSCLERIRPELIVLNTQDNAEKIQGFIIQSQLVRQSAILSLVELEDYLKLPKQHQMIIKPLRPKLLLSLIRDIMNMQKADWLPSLH